MKNNKIKIWGIIIIILCALGITGYRLLCSDYILKKVVWEKIWVHRTNSIEMLQEVNHKYAGVEVDVNYLDSLHKFDINHPPAESIGLSLYEYLKSNDNKQLKFWLDMKNLNEDNALPQLNLLDSIIQLLGYQPAQFIVESGTPAATEIFLQRGYQTSYYLHWPGLYTMKEEELDDYLGKIRENLKNAPTSFVSSPWWDYQILKQNFPQKDKLLWFAGAELEFSNPISKHLYRLKVAKDPHLKVILMDIKTKTPFR